MGMFDTFWGSYKCPDCGVEVEFEEQTKDYDCVLADFYLGDYIDKANENYFYDFENVCPNCGSRKKIALAIRKGQYAGICVDMAEYSRNIFGFTEIEEGFERRRMYRQMCDRKIGDETLSVNTELTVTHCGETIDVLQTEWIVDEAYEELPVTAGSYRTFLYHKGYVYKVHAGMVHRIVSVHKNTFTGEIYARVREDNLEQKKRWRAEDFGNRYILQSGCRLKKIE